MKTKSVFACINTNLKVRLNSSSGGVFSLLAEHVIKNNGVVYGVKMSDDCYSAEYERVTDIDNLDLLRRSKYLQAKIGDTYNSVKSDLLNGRFVLFSGTGCQINGLCSFLEKEYKNLILVDVVCYGVPSSLLWKKYAKHQEKKYGGKLVAVNFRCKEKLNWSKYGLKEEFKINNEKRKIIFSNANVDSYMQMFLRGMCLRPSCYNCTAKIKQLADITIADFWGVDKVIDNFNDEIGTSLILLRTNKGIKIFNSLSNKKKSIEVTYEDAVKNNYSEYKSAEKPYQRDFFYEDLLQMDYKDLSKKYIIKQRFSLKEKFKKKLKKILRLLIKLLHKIY